MTSQLTIGTKTKSPKVIAFSEVPSSDVICLTLASRLPDLLLSLVGLREVRAYEHT